MLLCVKVRDTDGDLFCHGPAHTRVTYSRDSYCIITCCSRATGRQAYAYTFPYRHNAQNITCLLLPGQTFAMAATFYETLAKLAYTAHKRERNTRTTNCVDNRCVVKIPLIHIYSIISEIFARGCFYIEFLCSNVVHRYTRLQERGNQKIHVKLTSALSKNIVLC